VDVEIILDQHDGLGVGEVVIGQFFQDVRVIHGGMAIGGFDMASAFERGKHHEEVGGAVALVLVIEPLSDRLGHCENQNRPRPAPVGGHRLRASEPQHSPEIAITAAVPALAGVCS
jgi:hypothetical protein